MDRPSALPIKIFSTTGSKCLADSVFTELVDRFNDPETVRHFGKVETSRGVTEVQEFSNENIQVTVENVRDCMAVVISTQTPPVNQNLMELMMLMHALKNSRAMDVLLVFPYMPYSRSDRKNRAHISSGGVFIPQIFSSILQVKRTLLLDPHDTHIKHYFEFGSMPAADEVTATYLITDYIERSLSAWGWNKDDVVVVFADSGASTRFRDVPSRLGVPRAYIDKSRPDHSESVTTHEIVGRVKGMRCIIFDDEILTGSTAVRDAETVRSFGAKSIVMGAIHAPLTDRRITQDQVIARLNESCIEKFIVTDSIPCRHKIDGNPKFEVLSVAPLLAESIKRIALGESLTALHAETSVGLYRTEPMV
jgi:ribose-phosphate pyrophosphokinase